MLKHTEARSIAESNWGTGGTHAYKTNRRGAYYFSCSGHGGFVIDDKALTETERAKLAEHATPDVYTLYEAGKKRRVMFATRSRAFRIAYDAKQTPGRYWLLEEDSAWCLAYVCCSITAAGMTGDAAEIAKGTFWHWFDKSNPEVQERDRMDAMRRNKSPDLIISASGNNDGTTTVYTADGVKHVVAADSYNWQKPLLSLTRIIA
jgi:hypothetical protein